MTSEETTRLAHALNDGSILNDGLDFLTELDNAEVDHDPDVIDAVVLAVRYVIDLKAAAGGEGAAIQDLEILLDPKAVADVVLTIRDHLADDLEEAVRAAGWEQLGPRRWKPPAEQSVAVAEIPTGYKWDPTRGYVPQAEASP